MFKNPIYSGTLNAALCSLGAGDRFAVFSAHFPIPEGIEVVDLALCAGIPDFETVFMLLSEQVDIDLITRTEELAIADERIRNLLDTRSKALDISIEALAYRQFKILTKNVRFAVRTGETEVHASVVMRAREVR